jgi:lipoprotein-anchoring transpeptidase ErfK/SrfK
MTRIQPADQRRRTAAVIFLLLSAVVMLAGCAPQPYTLAPLPTRTPKPTFTPTPAVDMSAQSDAVPPTPTATVMAAQPTPAPTPTYSSPAAAEVPKTGRAILVDQDQQYMYIFENGVEIRAIPCSTGDPQNHGTKAWRGVVGEYVGTFYSYGTYADYAWYLFDDHGRIMIHGAPYIFDENGQRIYLELDALGRYPVSHGCIRIHPDEARWLTFWNPKGVPIIITPWTGKRSLAEAPRH